MAVGLRPSTFTKSGGFINDVDVTLIHARFVLFDYDGKSDDTALTCCVTMRDGDGNDHFQYYSAGDKQYFVPSEDPKNPDNSGKTLVKVGERDSINDGCNFAIFLNSLVNAGFDEGALDSGDISAIEGTRVHVEQIPQPKRSGLPSRPGQKEREKTILVVTRILEGEAKATKPGAKAAPAKPAAGTNKTVAAPAKPAVNGSGSAPASDVDTDLRDELASELIGLFASQEVTELPKKSLVTGLFKSITNNPNKQNLIKAAGKDEYLSALEDFSYENGVLTIAG